ncbi:hypothetical protein [Vitiosangium sp. GDMCC 1.1324]|uniref:hypothetical protein n=1 Tax=Vitiosangium sp. (strain GDMCC 1.1324) TaxID=2138576 RepID=UPI000D38BADE|nr:hypothetical protein [Vitiosangium sp. GDMCC 1.1324]PTL84543.1 hypothetical protein DAT35_05500 [Vitiosangium sp. GDMCC 1.1324]
MRRLLAGSVAVSALALAGSAQASGECGSTSAGWNAPNGAVVFDRGPGPIRDVLDAVGEYRTHSMLSHGPGAGVSHATMRTPDQADWPGVCTKPIVGSQIQYGQPGLEQVNQGGIYMYIYGDPAAGAEWTGWQQGDPAQAALIGDSIWYNHPYVSDVSKYDSSQYVDRPVRNGTRINYSLFQYRDLQTTNQIPGDGVNSGIVCSTFMAYAHNYAGRGVVTPYTYSHAQIANASNSLYTGVYNECKQSLGWFTNALLTVACPFYNVCGNAGNQVANCMSTNMCDTNDSRYWKSVRDDPNSTARSISPDRVGGWGVHPTNNTIWGPDYSHQLQWNSGGNVYGCWQ